MNVGPLGTGSHRKRCLLAGVVVALLLGGSVFSGSAEPMVPYNRPGTTEIVSIASDGTQGSSGSQRPSISADGRYVAFMSPASEYLPDGGAFINDVFVRDREAGITEYVSVGHNGFNGNSGSWFPALSADGRTVAFDSYGTNLIPGDTNGANDVFVRDLDAGETERVSVASDGTPANANSYKSAVSADGRLVAFTSRATNLVPGDTNGMEDIFVHDRAAGTTKRVSVSSSGAQADGTSTRPQISDDGSVVAFRSTAGNLVPGDTNGVEDVFVHDLGTGTTERVSVAFDGSEADSDSGTGRLSADGRFVVFDSFATNLVPGDANLVADIFVHDRDTGVTERVSLGRHGHEANGGSLSADISADGRFVAFNSWAFNLVAGDNNGISDVFMHDRTTGETQRISVGHNGQQGNRAGNNNGADTPAMTPDARHIAFFSESSNLVPGDTNGAWDIFARDRGPAVGVGGMSVTPGGSDLSVSGWATFAGQELSPATDPADDGGSFGPFSAESLGAEILGASIAQRPEQGDVLLRMDVTELFNVNIACPNVEPVFYCGGGVAATGAGLPLVLYGFAFEHDGTPYEVRVLRAELMADEPATDPVIDLYDCSAECAQIRRLPGGIGVAGPEVGVAVPLGIIGAANGGTLTGLRAFTMLGEDSSDPIEVLDEMTFPDASLLLPTVELGIAPASVPEQDVDYTTSVNPSRGRFTGSLDTSSFPSGDHRVWARACLGDVCGVHSVGVAL